MSNAQRQRRFLDRIRAAATSSSLLETECAKMKVENSMLQRLLSVTEERAQMHWYLSHRADPLVKRLADRHYNRQNPDSPQFVPSGRCVVLRTALSDAFWVTLAPYAQYVRHRWAGAWTCTAFRNEGSILSSVLISQAVAASLFILKTPPALGFVTFVDPSKVRSSNPGCCFKKAGWQFVGHSKSGLPALQLLPERFPSANPPFGTQCQS